MSTKTPTNIVYTAMIVPKRNSWQIATIIDCVSDSAVNVTAALLPEDTAALNDDNQRIT